MTPTNSLTNLGQEQYMKLFLAQLQNQNPLEPLNDREMLTQLTQFSTLQGITQLNASFADLLQLQQLTQGSALIGRTVRYAPAGSDVLASGVVSSVVAEGGAVSLRVGSQTVPLSQVRRVEPTP